MRGTMIVIPVEGDPIATPLREPPTLDQLKEAVEGHIEVIPYFNTVIYGDVVMDCIAFCNETGKLKELPPNQSATRVWAMSIERITGSKQTLKDILVGNIAIVFGDRELMEQM